MKFFVTSDIHGDFMALLSGLDNAGYDLSNKNHQLIICGDLFGRAQVDPDDCIQIYKYVTSPNHKNPPIVLHGNHEDIILGIFRRNQVTYNDIYNGEHKTIASFARMDETAGAYDPAALQAVRKNFPELENWLKSLPYYFETKRYIFTHGWLPTMDMANLSCFDYDTGR